MLTRLPQFLYGNQIENIQAEAVKHLVGAFQGEEAFSLEDVMQVGLGDPHLPGKTAFGGCAAPHTEAKIVHKPRPQIVEGHRQAISLRNRVLPDSSVAGPN
jgi:hypothetical protein